MSLHHIRVVLVRPRQSGNIGGAARAIANHGLGGLVLVDPPAFDPERARWMAPGAGAVIDEARITATVTEAIADASCVIGTSGRRRRWDWPLLDPDGLSARAAEEASLAILFGPEDTGLSNADLALCHAVLCLPTAEHASLNLSAAVTVVAAGLIRDAVRGPPPEASPAVPVGLQADAVAAALRTLREAGYLNGRSEEQVQGTLYRLLSRARPSERELSVLRGMTAAVQYAISAGAAPQRPGE